MTTIMQGFSSETILDTDFTQSNPATGTFTWNATAGLNGSPGISVSSGSDQIWTTKQGYTISDSGEYVSSAFFQSSQNGGYGALGFSIQNQDSNTGFFGAPGGSHIGAFFHGGGGGFLNNGAIDTSGKLTANDSPIIWNNGGVKAEGGWYQFVFTVKANGSNQYTLNLKIYNATSSGTVESLITEHSMTDSVEDVARIGPAVTNTAVGGASTLHTFFSTEGIRIASIDNFQIDLAGGALLLEPGSPLVDLNGSGDTLNNTATFTEVVGADDGSAAVSFTTGASNLADLDSPNLNNLKVSLPTIDATPGDELLLGATQIDITGTTATGEVTYNSTVFSYAIADASGVRTVTFTSLDEAGGTDTAAPIVSYEALLDALKFNNTSDSPAANPTRTFSVTATDSENNVSDAATFTVTVVNVGPQLIYDTTTFTEALTDDGSIGNVITVTLQEDTFTGANGDSLGAVSNVPDGLTASLIRTGTTEARLSLTGQAAAHADANNITNLTVTFSDTDFANSVASDVGNSTTSNLSIDYKPNLHNPVIKGNASASIDEDTATNINGFTISDDDNPASLTVKIAASHGTLVLGTITDVTGTTSGSTLEFSGSIAALNTAVNSVTYQGALNYAGTDDLTIQISDDNGTSWHDYVVDEVGGIFFNEGNQHYYEFVSAPGITWTDAKAAAEGSTRYGLTGYLATVTSAEENALLTSKLGGQGWMGASDAALEGDWRWVTGPEADTSFWSGAAGGSAVDGAYHNWAIGEPNDFSGEDYAHFLLNGEWNDLPNDVGGSISGYVVEYGGDGFGTREAASLKIIVNDVNDAPVITNLDGDSVSATVNQVAFLDADTANSIADIDTTDFNEGTLKITTKSGTADGNFSLDGIKATAGGDSVIAANESIVVDAITIGTVHETKNGQGGNDLTITLNGNATLLNVSELIKNIGYTSTTTGKRDFELTLSEADGKTTDAAALSVTLVAGSAGSPGNSRSFSTIDGVVVEKSAGSVDGVTVSTTTVPVITSNRPEDASTERATHADIPLVTNSSNQKILQVGLPVGIGLTSQEITGTNMTLREKLITASNPKINDTPVFDKILQKGIDAYVATVSDESQITLRTITFTASEVIPDEVIVVTGAQGAGEGNLDNPLQQEALVVDIRNLPSGTVLQFDNIEFAVIIGAGRIVGGDGRNFFVGDGADQFIVLGAEDDILSGGFGDDTIGSRGGNDQLFGDEGNDYLIGGEGDDVLDGGEGNDLLQGGSSDAGSWSFSLNDQDLVVSTFTIKDSALSSASTLNIQKKGWFSENTPITNDSRVSFVYQDPKLLEAISTLYQGVLNRLPTTEEMNEWIQRGLTVSELGEIAFQAYSGEHKAFQNLTQTQQLTQLLNQVWGEDHVSSDWIDLGLEHLNNGGSWSEVLLFLVRHDNLKNTLLDEDGYLQLTQDLHTSELGWAADAGNDILLGGPGDDTLVGGRGHNILDGGLGVDSAVMTETADAHHFVVNGEGQLRVHRNDENSTNVLIDVENIVFSDKTLDISASNLNPATLKSIAALTQLVDQTTLTLSNLNQVYESDMTTIDVAKSLMLTDNYLQNWDVLSNSDFASQLSDAVFGTTAITDDDLTWTNQLDQGTLGREDILVIAVGTVDYQNELFSGDGVLLA